MKDNCLGICQIHYIFDDEDALNASEVVPFVPAPGRFCPMCLRCLLVFSYQCGHNDDDSDDDGSSEDQHLDGERQLVVSVVLMSNYTVSAKVTLVDSFCLSMSARLFLSTRP